MSNYLNYLEESTNIVKSKKKLSEIITLIAYLAIWTIALIFFWLDNTFGYGDGMVFGLLVFWLILPVSTFTVSALAGRNSFWGKLRWFSPLLFGIMYMLADYGTYRLANSIAFNKINVPDFSLFLVGTTISLVGLLLGYAFKLIRERKALST